MTREIIYSIWAPAGASWSAWMKPVIFARLSDSQTSWCPPQPAADVDWCPPADGTTAIVVDLPGGASVAMGVALADIGYRPVPLYNSAPGPAPVLDMAPVVAEIVRGTLRLREARLPPDAPPAFLLDSRRRFGESAPEPGKFDNRSISLPTDFPSANLLLHCGVRRCLLVQASSIQPQADLAHTLARWQCGGLDVMSRSLTNAGPAEPIRVSRPNHFRAVCQRMIALAGLLRSPLGGFGGVLPVPSSG